MSPPPTAQTPARATPFVVLVHGGKGGIGKTTLAEHLAWGFSAHGKTLLLDADGGQQSAKFLYDRYRCEVPYDVTVETDATLLSQIHTVPYEYVVIDGPPSADEAAAAIEVADLTLIPIVPRVLDTSAVMRTIRGHLDNRPYRVVLSRVSNTMGQTRVNAVLGALEGQGVAVLQTVVREYMGPHEAARTRGLPITHPDLAEGISGPAEGKTADRAAYDLRAVFGEVAALAGVR